MRNVNIERQKSGDRGLGVWDWGNIEETEKDLKWMKAFGLRLEALG
jgi:hypothetical protein